MDVGGGGGVSNQYQLFISCCFVFTDNPRLKKHVIGRFFYTLRDFIFISYSLFISCQCS